MTDPLLTSEVIQMLVSSVTHQGHAQLTELEAERLLNALARAQSGIPTGIRPKQPEEDEQNH